MSTCMCITYTTLYDLMCATLMNDFEGICECDPVGLSYVRFCVPMWLCVALCVHV